MKEVATIIPDNEFKKYLADVTELVDMWKNEGLGQISVKCQLVNAICGIENTAVVFTIEQLKQIFALAK